VKNTFILLLTVFTISIFSSTSWAEYGVVVQGGLCGSSGNSGGGTSGGNSGPGYGDDSGIPNPWAGYDYDVGLKYVKIGKKSSGHWHESVVWTENEIPNHRDFRIKVKNQSNFCF